ncbi:GntR family transcriptional regulator [Nocardiopsis sp. NPDC057823]|uniref:GntR family transcriptional regulator n=1 Tax=Nocardiopsis sp. NPDC057823 TaxID=3346256 RepID=UPI0036722644
MTTTTDPTKPPVQPYRRVLDDLLNRISAGEFVVGDRLPSTRELAEQHNVAPMTVRNALAELQKQGRAAPTHGVGWFLTEPPEKEPSLHERVTALEAEVAELRARLDHDSTVSQ